MMSNTNLKKIEGHISNLIRIRNSICAITSLPMSSSQDAACGAAYRAITIAIEQLQQIADSKPGAK